MENKVQGIIRLSGQEVANEEVSCTGLQLVTILEVLQKELCKYKWLIADISTNAGGLPELYISKQPLWIENTKALIDLVLPYLVC